MPNEFDKKAAEANSELDNLEAEVSKPEEAAGEETPVSESPTEESKQPDTQETEEVASEEAEATATEETTDEAPEDEVINNLSEKAQERFKRMAKERREAVERAKKLEEQLKGNGVVETPQGLPWDLEGQTELTVEQLRAIAKEEARQEIASENFFKDLNSDIKIVEDKYPILNEDHPDYDDVLARKISSWYQGAIKEDRSLRFGQFVEEIMGLQEKGLEKGRTEGANKVAKQAAEQALPPSNVSPSKTVSVEDKLKTVKSWAELDELESSLG